MNYIKALLIFIAVLFTLYALIALPAMAAGQKAGWYTLCVLGSASALITAIFVMPTDVPRGTKDDP